MECYPFSKVGGMADVVGSLPAALRAAGVETQVLTPYYSQVYTGISKGGGDGSSLGAELARFEIEIGGVSHPVRLIEGDEHTVLLEEPVAYDRPGIYDNPVTGVGFDDSLYRCLVLQQAARFALREGYLSADVVHCHDNHTGLLPVYLKDDGGPPTVFTIHNLAYQGIYSGDDFPITGLDPSRFFGHSAFEYYGDLSLMKAGLLHADLVTAVSPNYAAEIVRPEQGNGLDGVLRQLGDRLVGVINGIDQDLWNPATDDLLPARYSAADPKGKRKCRARLRKRVGIDADREAPLCGIVSRVTNQKGLDIVASVLPWLVNAGAQFVLLGSGDPALLDLFRGAHGRWPDRVGLLEGYDEELAHLVYAGSDLYLMPSRFEPCGLSQLFALRYGAVPVVTATGGLVDTIAPVDEAAGTGVGVLADWPNPESFQGALEYALELYSRPESFERIRRDGMLSDFGWKHSAARYRELYERVLGD